MPSEGELHAWNRWNMGNMGCGCSKYNVEVMGCDHDCDYDGGVSMYDLIMKEKPEPKVPFEVLDESIDTLLGCRKFFPQCLDIVTRLHDKFTAGF